MKKSKLLVALLAAVALLASLAACSLTQVEAISFTNAPAASYELNQSVDAKQFSLTITYDNGNTRTVSLNDSILSVTGLVDGRLDTRTVGQKTVVVSYRGVTISVYYNVVGEGGGIITPEAPTVGDGKTADTAYEIATPENLAAIKSGEKTTYYQLTKDIDLAGYEWVPLADKTGDSTVFIENIVLLGNGKNIRNLTITTADKSPAMTLMDGVDRFYGLFAGLKNAEVKELTITDASINISSTQSGDHCKDVAALAGTSFGNLTITDVIVNGGYFRSNGVMAGIVARPYANNEATITITGCRVTGAYFEAYNPDTIETADGQGDKIGGIFGQLQNSTVGKVVVSNCTVSNCTMYGTRDLGGLIGMSTPVTLNNNTVTGCTISASVPGGMLERKGLRNIGGLVGTIQTSVVIDEKGTTMVSDNYLVKNDTYEGSCTGKYIGGFRRDQYKAGWTITKGTATLNLPEYTGGDVFKNFVDWQLDIMPEINDWLGGGELPTFSNPDAPAE